MKKSEPKSEIEMDEIKTILHQLQSMQVPTDKKTPKPTPTSPPPAGKTEAPAAPRQMLNDKNDYTIIAAFSAVFVASLVGGYFLYDNHSDIRDALKDFTNPKITGTRKTEEQPEVAKIVPSKKVEKPQIVEKASLTAPYTSNTTPYSPGNNRKIKQAEALMKKGQIQKARQLLTKEADETAASGDIAYVDISFLLAQSYDPNYLSGLSFSDSDADLVEAERWYREWYRIASQKGIVKNQQSLQGILETLR